MKKTYKKIDDYFVDKEQLKRYKKKTLNPKEKIILTNNDSLSQLNINIDDFEDAILIFQKSSFSDLKIINSNNNIFSNVKFIGCNINEGEISLNHKSNIELDESCLKTIKVQAQNINLKNISCNDNSKICNIILGNSHTDKINIDGVLEHHKSTVIINAEGKKININNTDIVLSPKADDVNINNSKIVLWKVEKIRNLIVNNSLLTSYLSCFKRISCSTLYTFGFSTIEGFCFDTEVFYVAQNSVLTPINLCVNVENLFMLGNNSKIEKSELGIASIVSNNLYLNPNSYVNIDNIKHENSTNSCLKILNEQLTIQRETFVKTLKLVENKCNRPVGEVCNND